MHLSREAGATWRSLPAYTCFAPLLQNNLDPFEWNRPFCSLALGWTVAHLPWTPSWPCSSSLGLRTATETGWRGIQHWCSHFTLFSNLAFTLWVPHTRDPSVGLIGAPQSSWKAQRQSMSAQGWSQASAMAPGAGSRRWQVEAASQLRVSPYLLSWFPISRKVGIYLCYFCLSGLIPQVYDRMRLHIKK